MDSDILVSRTRTATTAQGATGYLTIDLAALGRNYCKLVSMLA
ncbi:alanine racemase, partial [Rhizobium sp. PEPV16]